MVALRLLLAAAALASPQQLASGLKYLSYYGDNVTAQHEWLSLAITEDGATTDAFYTGYKIPSLLRMPDTGVYTRGTRAANGTQLTGGGLVAGWEGVLDTFAKVHVLPRLANKTALGVFLGDEICCHNSSCWHGQIYPLSAKLRALLGPSAILYENECGDSIAGGGMAHGHPIGPPLDKIAPDLDWLSFDVYKGYSPKGGPDGGSDGASEAAAAKAFAEKIVYPIMAPHQKLVVVPGTFACSNLTYMPLEASAKSVIAKLKAYFEWGKTDERMVAINPWHFNRRDKPQNGPPCDMELGAVDLPGVVDELATIGKWIQKQH
jgi:hypothetical protein